MDMRRLIAIMALLVLPFIANAQIKDSVDVSYKARGTHIYQDGRKMSDQEVKDIVISRIGNAETRYQEYLKAQKDFRAGILNMGGDLHWPGCLRGCKLRHLKLAKKQVVSLPAVSLLFWAELPGLVLVLPKLFQPTGK